MLLQLEERLERVRDAQDLPKVIRIAAIASLLILEKYSRLSELSEVYRISMGMHAPSLVFIYSPHIAVMCPNKKLGWFDIEEAAEVEELVRQRWLETYEISDREVLPQPNSSPIKVCHFRFIPIICVCLKEHSHARDGWLISGASHPVTTLIPSMPTSKSRWSVLVRSTMLGGCFNTGRRLQPPVHTSLVWHWIFLLHLVSRLCNFYHDLINPSSQLTSSVDAERAFSGGRLQVNHLQHGINSQTFRAQMAVGSWVGSDIFPTLDPFEKIIECQSRQSRKGKEKEVAIIDDDGDDTDIEMDEHSDDD